MGTVKLPWPRLPWSGQSGFRQQKQLRSSKGVPYTTVADIATGRLDLSSAPRIAADVAGPERAGLSPRCVLVVRSGSVGGAAKVHAVDCHACISSHLIRLEFANEEQAAAV